MLRDYLNPLITAILAGFLVSSCTSVSTNTPLSTANLSPSESLLESSKSLDGAVLNPALNVDRRGRALQGYDVVAYFENQQAVPGDSEWSVSYQGANWHFSNSENSKKFVDNPEKYVPENGGYCTFGVVLSKKFDGDPTIWLIYNEELYVFLNEDVKKKFLQDEVGNFERVRNNWPSIKDKLPEEL